MGIWTGHHVRTRASAGAVSHDGPPDEGWPWGGPGVRAQVGAGVWDHTAKPEKQQAGGLSRARAQIQRSGLEASTEAPRRPGGSPHTPICSLPEVSPGREEEAPPDSSFLPWACLALPLRWGGRPHGQRGPRPELSTAPLRPSPFPRPGDPRPTFPLGLEKLRKQKTEKVFGSKSDILGHEYDKSPY